MKAKTYNVLITSIGSTTSIGIIKFIKESAFEIFIVGTDIHSPNRIAGANFCNKFYQVPRYFDNDYIITLHEIVRKEKIDLIIPVHDQEVEMLSANRQQFKNQNCTILTSDLTTIETVNNKLLFAHLLNKNSIKTPETYSVADWFKVVGNYNQKWVLKPINGVSGRGIVIGKAQEIRQYIISNNIDKDYIVQQYVKGVEYTVDIFVKAKVAYCIVPRVRDEVREGLCYKAYTVPNEEFSEQVKEIVMLFDFYGPINIQFIKDDFKGEIYCIECNPRFGGSSIITMHAGINLFDLALIDYEGSDLKPIMQYKDVYMTRYWEEIIYEH